MTDIRSRPVGARSGETRHGRLRRAGRGRETRANGKAPRLESQAGVPAQRLRIAIVVTAEVTAAKFVAGFASFLADRGHEVCLIADAIDTLRRLPVAERVSLRAVPMAREPRPIADCASIVGLHRAVAEFRPHVVLYATPKASLLAAVVSWVLRVRTRVYLLWGLRLETTRGWLRLVLALAERTTSYCSTVIVPNSRSLMRVYGDSGLQGHRPMKVLGAGSSHGVDIDRFNVLAEYGPAATAAARFRERYTDGLVLGFVGRLHPDKGIGTLLSALEICQLGKQDVGLIMVGPDEGAADDTFVRLAGIGCAIGVGAVDDVRPYYRLMDVLVLVSEREGFPNVVLEAAAMGVAAIVSDGTGLVDSVEHGTTGYVVPRGDAPQLARRIASFADEPELSERLGRNARARAVGLFEQTSVWNRYAQLIEGQAMGCEARIRESERE